MEMRVAIEEFIKRYPKFTLAAGDADSVTWSQGQVRGARNLPLTITK